ncbi:hypothetical protein EDD27_9670 [Nonomuraea polychroma]|uniref:Uncharacterized protein n=1 Tax=Nonomuraea polychroma TaxID=46176 RepID=A0A438MLY0_9ACTN|nr:hypothetical protein [Nonomuraea polychroma]RVX46768.1 hypothetical protein EDD27_9670 [Nonomuraea polychroma]
MPPTRPCFAPAAYERSTAAGKPLPAFWLLLAVVLATVLVVAALTAVPARLGGRRPVTEAL